jgi:alpha-ketoglutarate-dependent taurine dioxygenase
MNQSFKETYCAELDEFLNLGKSLGKLIPSRKDGRLLDILTPKKEDEVFKNSLSKTHGLGEFPPHTDCAYLRNPPKYILLRYVGKAKKVAPTIVMRINEKNLNDKEMDFLKRAIWVVRGVEGKFYTTLFKDGIFRYDAEVMSLISNTENLIQPIIEKSDKIKIEWSENKVLILNNWLNLHSRPSIDIDNYKERILQRLNIA